MKTTRWLAASLAAFTFLPVMAQGPGQGPMRGSRVDFLTGYLSLTDTQKTQAQAIFDAADKQAQVLQGQMASARDDIKAAVKASKPDTTFDTLGAALGALEGQMAAIDGKAQAKFYAILTPEQQAKYDSITQRGPGPMRGPGGPGAAGMGGRPMRKQ
jgi:Spy/CpxP family protein refolding chaperone